MSTKSTPPRTQRAFTASIALQPLRVTTIESEGFIEIVNLPRSATEMVS
jgi:hypothetical protein